jgi:SAM-dependent methyltransferase
MSGVRRSLFKARVYRQTAHVPDGFYFKPTNAEAYDADMGRAADAMDDLPFYLGLARQAAARGEAVLELGCGTGRVTIPIARAGAEIVGLDNAPAMLAVARRKAAEAGVRVHWVTADMRDFRLEQRFGLVIIPFRSFLHLLTDADQEACLRRIQEHLLPGGRLALNFFVQKLAERAGSPVISRIYRDLQVRYVSRGEMERLLQRCGFEVEALSGWFDERPFSDSSSEMVWLARRPNAAPKSGRLKDHGESAPPTGEAGTVASHNDRDL